jgi:hypothetical protein
MAEDCGGSSIMMCESTHVAGLRSLMESITDQSELWVIEKLRHHMRPSTQYIRKIQNVLGTP